METRYAARPGPVVLTWLGLGLGWGLGLGLGLGFGLGLGLGSGCETRARGAHRSGGLVGRRRRGLICADMICAPADLLIDSCRRGNRWGRGRGADVKLVH